MAKWSWDEFAGGLAAGGVAGLGQGADLARARNATRQEQLRTALTFSDEIAGLADTSKSQDALGGLSTAVQEIDPALTGTTDLGRARGMLAQSDQQMKLLESLTDAQIEAAKHVKEIKRKQIQAGGIRDVSTDYINTGAQLEVIARQAQQLQIQMGQAKAAGDDDAFEVLSQKLDRLVTQKDQLTQVQMKNAAALSGYGVEMEDIDRLRKTGDKRTFQQILIEKYAGTGKTRTPGARGR